jgi:hypothetical protein
MMRSFGADLQRVSLMEATWAEPVISDNGVKTRLPDTIHTENLFAE